ncbi:MAG: hypothetical protein Q8Q12_20775 [bacterium]|nr:hypothetical protein [bacterium]
MRNALVVFAWILATIFAASSVTLERAAGERSLFEQEEAQAETSASSEATVPHTDAAKALAKQVLTKMNESSYSFAQTDVEGLDAAFSVEQDEKQIGKLTLTWQRSNAKVITQLEGDIPAGRKAWLQNMVQWAMKITVLGVTPVEEKYPTYAAKIGERYVLDGSDDPNYAAKIMLVSEDYARDADIMQFDDGLVIHTEYEMQSADGKHFVKSVTRTVSLPKTDDLKANLTFTYTHRDGYIFTRRIVIDDTGPEGQFKWKLELDPSSLAFRRPEVTEPETVVTEPEKEPEVTTVTIEPETTTTTETKPEVSEPPSKETLVVPEPPAGYVKGEWADARVGTHLRIKTFRPDVFGNVPVTLFMDVIKADEKTVTVKTMGMEEGKVVREGERVQQRFISKEQFEKGLKDLGEKEGNATIEISSTEYKCEVYRKDARLEDGTEVERRTYVCWEIPTWAVRRVSSKSGTIYEIADFKP